jgi:cyclase
MKNVFLIIIFFVMASTVFGALARPEPQMQATPMTVEKIRENIYMVKGGAGANTGFVIGDKEVVVIDVKMTPDSGREMLAAIAKVSPLPVTTIILTHSDGDHVNGFPAFPKGLKIIAQEKCLEELEAASKEQPFLKDYLPTVTFDSALTLKAGTLTLDLRHYGPAHTSGDTVIDIPEASVAFVGDLAFLGRDPLIHRRKNGSSVGLVKTLKAILDYKPAIGVFISGHADPLGPADIEGLIRSVQEKQEKIKTLVSEGKTLDEVKKAFGLEDPPAGQMRFPSLVEVIYLELTEKK